MKRAFEVRLSDVHVGYLSEADDGRISFRFSDDYRLRPDRPILSQSFEDDLDRTYRAKGRELPPFFANLVPEGHLRGLIESSLDLDRGDDLGLLAAVGHDLPGAVDIRPAVGIDDFYGENGKDDGAQSRPDDEEHEPSLRFSLAGVQLKFSIAREFEKLTLPAHGTRGEWIVKLDSPRFPNLVENEFAMLEWARAAGFEVPECELLPVSTLSDQLRAYANVGNNVLILRRYDRTIAGRLHQEDFAQVTAKRPIHKYDHVTYDQCAALINRVIGSDGYLEFVRRLAFMIAAGNSDAHLKNWSLLYRQPTSAVLTPLYDQVSTIAWEEVAREFALKLGGVKTMLQVDESAFDRFARRARMSPSETLDTVHSTIRRVADAWPLTAAIDFMAPKHLATLREYWSRAPLLKGHAGTLLRAQLPLIQRTG
jgi:serine/threonine-protein kinase HipA